MLTPIERIEAPLVAFRYGGSRGVGFEQRAVSHREVQATSTRSHLHHRRIVTVL
jgi:hypothetical protein